MEFVNEVCNDGYAIVENALDDACVSHLIGVLDSIASTDKRRGGIRNLLDISEMRELASSPQTMRLVSPILGDRAFAVRGILFDKKEGVNWKVPWHQDVTIAVKKRVDVEGYGPWSVKQDVLHVQPPSKVLDSMLSVRLHLDDCPFSNGALRVIPQSHAGGKLSEDAIAKIVADGDSVVCEVKQGGALLMRPLTVHASSTAEVPQHRRVIHFDFANCALAEGLDWYEVG